MNFENFYAAALAVMAAGGAGALASGKKPTLSQVIGCCGLLAGIILFAIPVCAGLFADPINLFRVPVLILGAAGACFSPQYLKGHGSQRSGIYYFFFNLTVAAMLGVTIMNSPLPFLVMWEVMGLASFALVAFDYKSRQVARAAWIYLLACQAGGMVLIGMFLLASSAESLFWLSVVGFGLKIGFPLLHVWLPEAHPAAPAPVSALMSGAMIQLGFYGIWRWGINGAFAHFEMFGATLVMLGVICCLGGIILSFAHTNIKTLLAYSSIENMGIISLGFGLGLLGLGKGCVPMAFCGFAGAGLHMLNHALLKGGLFLLAGSVQKATGSLEMEKMGGLLKKMPVSGSLFLMNSAGLSGLPPFNAFVSEFLIYLAGFAALTVPGKSFFIVTGIAVPVVLALTGGLAAAAFCKVSGAVFLGEPRSEKAANAVEVPLSMRLPVIGLFLLGCTVTVLAPAAVRMFAPQEWLPELYPVIRSLRMVAMFSVAVTGLFVLLLLAKYLLLPRGKQIRSSCTWDCGFSKPDARMEYTGSAFIQPLVVFFGKLAGVRRTIVSPEGSFPGESSFEEKTGDPGLELFWKKLFSFVFRLANKLNFLQSGHLHFYILIMTAALVLMLVWGFLLPWAGSFVKGEF